MTRSVELTEKQGGGGLPSREWWAAWKEAVGDDLLGGYATLCFPDQARRDRDRALLVPTDGGSLP